MKSIVNRVIVAFLLASLAGTAAFAKSKKAGVFFLTDTKVNGTVVQKGRYDVVFDDQTGELSIVKNNKVIARTATRVEKRARKAQGTEAATRMDGSETELVSVTFDGSNENLVVKQAAMQAGGN
jgi:hypothetical protein